MPSWIHSRITIRGDAAALKEITEANFDMEILAPRPEDIAEEAWNLNVLGTHFEGGIVNIEDQDQKNQIEITVSSAWSPPTKYCAFLLKKFQNLWIKIVFEDADLGGVVILRLNAQGEVDRQDYMWREPWWNGETFDSPTDD